MKITKENFLIKIGQYNIYQCPNCIKNDIKTNYNFCPHCGISLDFSEINEKPDYL